MSIEPPANPAADPAAAPRTPALQPARFDVFLSHHNADKPAVERIARALQERGLTPWLDTWVLSLYEAVALAFEVPAQPTE
jgi:hypothetical protein